MLLIEFCILNSHFSVSVFVYIGSRYTVNICNVTFLFSLECEENYFGTDCSKECYCIKDKCNAESGLCEPGGCLPQWVDLYPPYSCQTGKLIRKGC